MSTFVVLLVIAIVAAVGAPLAVARPLRTVLPLYAGSLPIASAVKLDIPLPSPFNTLSSLLGAAAVAACLGHVALAGRGRTPSLPLGVWLGFGAWATASALWSISSKEAVADVLVATPLLLLVIVAALPRADEADLDALRVALIVSGIIVGAYALGLLLTGRPLPTHGTSQRFSIATSPQDTNPNILAASLLLPMAASTERILLGGSRWWSSQAWRLLGVAGAFFSFVAIVFTGSRGGLLAAVLSFAVCLYSGRRVPVARAMIRRVLTAVATAGVGLLVAVALVVALAPSQPGNGILSTDAIQRITNTQNGSSGRFEIWTAGYRACEHHCGWGAGIGNFPTAFNEQFAFTGVTKNVGLNRPAHDIYLQVAVELGVVGLMLLGLALFFEWRLLSRPWMASAAPALKGGLVGVLVANVFLSALWFKYFWLVFVAVRVAEGALERDSADAQPTVDRVEGRAPRVAFAVR